MATHSRRCGELCQAGTWKAKGSVFHAEGTARTQAWDKGAMERMGGEGVTGGGTEL